MGEGKKQKNAFRGVSIMRPIQNHKQSQHALYCSCGLLAGGGGLVGRVRRGDCYIASHSLSEDGVKTSHNMHRPPFRHLTLMHGHWRQERTRVGSRGSGDDAL